MRDKPTVEMRDGVTFGVYQPGDGTAYTACAVAWPYGPVVSFGNLGSVDERGWLVVCGLNSKAHLFQADGMLTPDYVAEKLELKNAFSIRHMTTLVAAVTLRERAPLGISPREEDIGRKVLYFPPGTGRAELGAIKSFNDSLVFVDYKDSGSAKGTYRQDLEWYCG